MTLAQGLFERVVELCGLEVVAGFEVGLHQRLVDLDDLATPPPYDPNGPTVREIEMRVTAEQIEIANGLTYEAWLYNGTAPGPTLRANEGDLLRIHFRNLTGKNHNLHFQKIFQKKSKKYPI